MLKEKKYWITYFAPGSFTANTNAIEYKELPLLAEIEWPENAYAFTLHQREDAIDGEKVYKGESEQIGPMYYHPDSKTTTLEETKQHPHATKILISNMECNGWEAVVWTRWGNWPQPFENGKHEILRAI